MLHTIDSWDKILFNPNLDAIAISNVVEQV